MILGHFLDGQISRFCALHYLVNVAAGRDASHFEVVVVVGKQRAALDPILAAADVLLLVTSPEISAAVSTSEWMQANGRVSPVDPGLAPGKARIVFVDSPGGVPFPRTTLSSELGDQFAAWLPWESTAVDLIYRGAKPDDRRLRRSALMGSVNQMTLDIATRQPVDA